MGSSRNGPAVVALTVLVVVTAPLFVSSPGAPPPAQVGVLDVSTDRECYGPGATVDLTLRNVGSTNITWAAQPPPVWVFSYAPFEAVSMPTRILLPFEITIEPNETYPLPLSWDQRYYVYDPDDPDGTPLPPSDAPVPEGEYVIAVYSDLSREVLGATRIRIDWGCAPGDLVADAGPDIAGVEGSGVELSGLGSGPSTLGDWQVRADIPSPRTVFAHAVIGGRIYVAGGYGWTPPPDVGPSTTESYDIASDAWTTVGDGPGCGGMPGIAGAALDGRFFAFGAYVGPCDVKVNSTQVFDEASGRWLPRADMPTLRVDLAVAVLGGKAYAVGGRTMNRTPSSANEVYDWTTNSWEVRAPMPTPRAAFGLVAVGGLLYAIGGTADNPVEVYSPDSDTWTVKPSLPGFPLWPAAAVFEDRIYLVYARNSFDTTVSDIVLNYDPEDGSLLAGPTMHFPRFGSGLEAVGDALVAVGGSSLCFAGNPCPVNATEALGIEDVALQYSWDADDRVDTDSDGNTTNDADASGPVLRWTYGDDGEANASLTVSDAAGRIARDTARVRIANVAPTVTQVEVTPAEGVMDLGLRVAGRKWNAAILTLLRDGIPVASVGVRRSPGSPDDQVAWIAGPFESDVRYSAEVTYEPADLGGGEVGANPVWIVGRFANGSVTTIVHHTFNVERSVEGDSGHWTHIEPRVAHLSLGSAGPATVRVTAEDPGSDDLTFAWSTGAIRTYLNDGLGPDPRGSPWGVYPFGASDALEVDPAPGTVVEVRIVDDDGGEVIARVTL